MLQPATIAVFAVAARAEHRDDDMVAELKVGHAGADLLHHAGALMA